MSSLRLFPQPDASLDAKSISNPHPEFGVHDTLRFGLTSVSKDLEPKHPLESSLALESELEFRRKLTLQRDIYGLHAPLRLQMERALISGRPTPSILPSYNLAKSILEGSDESLDVKDILGFPDQPFETPDFHTMMERQFGC